MLTITVSHAKSGSPIRYVKANGTGDGSSWANASGNLQAMINASSSGTQVWVAGGTYKPTGNSRSISFAMKNGVAIYGGFAGSETNLSQRPAISLTTPSATTLSGDIGTVGSAADNSYHVIYNSAGLTSTAILDGFVITGGNANGSDDDANGGGMNNNGYGKVCSPTLTNCAFQSNSAQLGGAMYNNGSAFGTSSPTLTNCAFLSNSASGNGKGGAMYNKGYLGISSPTLTNCAFLNNGTDYIGGAIYNEGGGGGTSSPTLTNCSFLSNSAQLGGAIHNDVYFDGISRPTLTNCVLFDNGGDNTFTFNNAAASALTSYSLFDASVTGYNTTGTGNKTTTTNPFVSANSVALVAGSAAINAGSNAAYITASGPTTDLAGNPRIYPVGGTIDMGAIEFQGGPLTLSASAKPSAVCAGGSTELTAEASGGTTPYTYAWRAPQGVTLSATNTALISATAGVGLSGVQTLTVTVTDGASPSGSVTATVDLTVQAPPAITVQPVGATKCVGDAYTFTVTGTSIGSFQWQKDGTPLNGATQATLALTNLQQTNAGVYRVVVNGAGACAAQQVTSSDAALGINVPVSISTQPTATAVCEGSNATFTVQAGGTITGYQWYRNGTAITGATSASYQLTTSTANNSDKFKVDVIGSCGTLTSSEVTLSVNAKPVITLQPVGATKCVGEGYTFTLTATNAGSYQWQKDATNVGGATQASLALTSLQTTQAGSYRVLVNGAGACASQQVVSNAAVLVVNAPPVITNQPLAQPVCEGATVGFSVQATGLISGYQWYRNGAAIANATGSSYQFTTSAANNGEKYKVDVVGSCGTLTSNEVTLTVNPRPAAPSLSTASRSVVAAPNTSVSLLPFVVATGTLSFSGVNGLLSTPTADISLVGVQRFSVTQTSQAGCISPALAFDLTVLSPLPPASQTGCRNSQVVMNVYPTGVRYEWYKNGQTAANKLIDVAGVQRGTTTASLTLVSIQTNASYYAKVFTATGSFSWYGPFAVVVDGRCSGRLGLEEPTATLQVVMTPNPLENNQLRATVSGAGGQSLTVQLLDMRGQVLHEQHWSQAGETEVVSWEMGRQPGGLYLLQALTNSQRQTIKVLKP